MSSPIPVDRRPNYPHLLRQLIVCVSTPAVPLSAQNRPPPRIGREPSTHAERQVRCGPGRLKNLGIGSPVGSRASAYAVQFGGGCVIALRKFRIEVPGVGRKTNRGGLWLLGRHPYRRPDYGSYSRALARSCHAAPAEISPSGSGREPLTPWDSRGPLVDHVDQQRLDGRSEGLLPKQV